MCSRQRLRKVVTGVLLLSSAISLASGAPSMQTQPVVTGNTAFALDLYSRLKSGPPNLFFSPYSISTCLAMTYAGARGETAQHMAHLFHFSADVQQVASSFRDLQRRLNQAGQQTGIQLNVANALWAQEGHAFLPDFLNLARNEYHANVHQADFKTGAQAARADVNSWVAQQTHDRIKDILPPGSIDPRTRLVLANAIYFKGAWAEPFRASETHPLPFHVSTSRQLQVPLMHQTALAGYLEDSDMQALELPYARNTLSMVVLLPRRIDGCPALEDKLTPSFLSSALAQMKREKVDIFLPKFKQDSAFDLKSELAKMGMANAFGPTADFSGMDGTRNLYISGVFHKAWVEVNEQGTEAAAATATTMQSLALVRPVAPPPVFRADHPFIFLIRDPQSGSILFLGRLAQPPAES
jgi:serine protease inhibitor